MSERLLLPMALLAATAPAYAQEEAIMNEALTATMLNVRSYGAKGDGVTDDTAAIQTAIDAVKGTGGTVVVPAGTYMINPGYNTMGGNSGLLLNGAMTLQIDSGATLQAKTTTLFDYSVVSVLGGENVKITGGGTISGDLATHASKTDFGGFPIQIQFSNYITVDGVTVTQAPGDGIMIRANSSHVTLNHVTSTGNSRQGLSIIDGNHLSILNSTFENTSGLPPACGIDVEPDNSFHVDTVLIQGNRVIDNDGCGISLTVAPKDTYNTSVANVTVNNNVISGNGKYDTIWMTGTGIAINNVAGTKITNNKIDANYGEGIMLGYKHAADDRPAKSTAINGNTITNQKTAYDPAWAKWSGGGIYIWSAADSRISDNSVIGNATNGIICPLNGQITEDETITFSENTIKSNGKEP